MVDASVSACARALTSECSPVESGAADGASSRPAVEVDVENFGRAFGEAYASALTKFDSLDAYFSSGGAVPSIATMLMEEIQQDKDFAPFLVSPRHVLESEALLKRAVGRANAAWRKAGGMPERARPSGHSKGENFLPWPSIDAYPEWVVGQIENYANAEPFERASARTALEHALLEKPLCAATIKYDGTCFGKMHDGNLAGRKQLLGTDCEEYQKTSTASASSCDVAALRRRLCDIMGVEVGAVCVWGELMCNPAFYSYKARGLYSKWLCFGVVVALPGSCGDESEVAATGLGAGDVGRLALRLSEQGLAHSISGSQVRLCLCPALHKLLQEVACCEVVDLHFPGLTHAEAVAHGAAGLRSGENEGLVLVFARANGQASVRKWKNSGEGGTVCKKHAQLLNKCLGWCKDLVSQGRLDERIVEMVETMLSVAEAATSVEKKGNAALR